MKNISIAATAAILTAFTMADVASAATFGAGLSYTLQFPQGIDVSISPPEFRNPPTIVVGDASAISRPGSITSSSASQISINIGGVSGSAGRPGVGNSSAGSRATLSTIVSTSPGQSFTGFIQGYYFGSVSANADLRSESSQAYGYLFLNGVNIVDRYVGGSRDSNIFGSFAIPINLSPQNSTQSFNIQGYIGGSAGAAPVPEPFTIIGTIVGGTAAFRMRKKLKAAD
jgi:hypothetical protein